MMDVLLIDDDEKICALLRDYLEPFGFHLHLAHTGHEGLDAFTKSHFDLVLLDMMLPDIDGLSVLRELQREHKVPVVILSAQDEELSRILGLEMGADDYVPKTFSPRELLARLRAVLRRTPQSSEPSVNTAISVGGLHMDQQTFTTTLDQRILELTLLEFRLLYTLAEHPGRVYSRDQLLELLGRESSRFDRSVDMHISSLRRKLGDDPQNPRHLRTVRGAGYCFTKNPV
ncbi:MAG: response regulator transcription factor [Desulfovibrionaceae bacterium]